MSDHMRRMRQQGMITGAVPNDPPPSNGPTIFISYRRHDTAGICGCIYNRLVARYGNADGLTLPQTAQRDAHRSKNMTRRPARLRLLATAATLALVATSLLAGCASSATSTDGTGSVEPTATSSPVLASSTTPVHPTASNTPVVPPPPTRPPVAPPHPTPTFTSTPTFTPTPVTPLLYRIRRYYANSYDDHWVTVLGHPPSNYYTFEFFLGWVVGPERRGTYPLYSCELVMTTPVSHYDHFLSIDPRCEGQTYLRTEGYIYAQPTDPDDPRLTFAPLYRCYTGTDHFAVLGTDCGGTTLEFRLGYVVTGW